MTSTSADFSSASDGSRGPGPTLESALWSLASAQYGAVARSQLLQSGFAAHVIDRRLKMGRLRALHRGVYLVGPLRGRYTQQMAAVLACGGEVVVSHRSAAVLWEVLAPDGSAVVEVSTFHHGQHAAAARANETCGRSARAQSDARLRTDCAPTSRHGIRVHRVLTLAADDVTVHDGIPVTTVARTLYDVARTAPAHDVETALAHALDRRLIETAELRAWLDRRPRHAGAPRLRALLGAGQPPALLRSAAEAGFRALVRKAQLPVPQSNVRVHGFEADFYWRAERLVVEIDGFAYHASARMFESDRRRDAVLMSAGIRVMRVTWKQLENEPEALLVRLTRALAQGVG